MKKLFLALLTAVLAIASVQARDSYSRDVKTLPAAAQNTLGKNFKASVSLIKIDKTLGHIDDYEVILTDGTEVEFDSKGNWKSVETSGKNEVPKALLPKAIYAFLAKAHKGSKVVGAEKSGSGYEIELNDGIELKFDSSGVFKKYDD